MTSGILKPLAIFCSQYQSQRYINSIRNLGDAWRTLAEEPIAESDRKFTSIETTFDFSLKIQTALEDEISVDMVTSESPSATEPSKSSERARHFRIFADYGTDFIWRDFDDIRKENDEESYVEAEEALYSFPPSVLESYNAWVDYYSDCFKTRCEDKKDYMAKVFLSASEEVAWNVAGYLLAWRIVVAPQIGSIRYSAGNSKYLLEQGNETSVTRTFLKDQMEILAKGESTD